MKINENLSESEIYFIITDSRADKRPPLILQKSRYVGDGEKVKVQNTAGLYWFSFKFSFYMALKAGHF